MAGDSAKGVAVQEIAQVAANFRNLEKKLPSPEIIRRSVSDPVAANLMLEAQYIARVVARYDNTYGPDADEVFILLERGEQIAATLDLVFEGGELAGPCTQAAREARKRCREECKNSGKTVCGCVGKWLVDVAGCFIP